MTTDISTLYTAITGGDRIALARGITLVESRKAENRVRAAKLVELCSGVDAESRRIGISGSPGVGKSTFIEVLGMALLAKGRKPAVLSIDPSSRVTGGSILGDKTRMPELSTHPDAFVRPTAAGDTLGGVAEHTRETIILCEAAGFTDILIETVGVGQSETEVSKMVDCFLLLLLPGSGDELQGMKRGIVELANILVINKADGDRVTLANATKLDYTRALNILQNGNPAMRPKVLQTSALDKTGFDVLLTTLDTFFAEGKKTGYFYNNRADQAVFWYDAIAQQKFQHFLFTLGQVKTTHDALRRAVADQKKSVTLAIQELELCLKNTFQG